MNPQRGKGTVEYVVSARSRDSTLEHVMSEHRLTVSSGSPFEATIGFSRAVRAGDRVLVSGTAPVWPDGSCDPDPEVQARRCFEIIVQALREPGARPEQVVRTRMYVTGVAYATRLTNPGGCTQNPASEPSARRRPRNAPSESGNVAKTESPARRTWAERPAICAVLWSMRSDPRARGPKVVSLTQSWSRRAIICPWTPNTAKTLCQPLEGLSGPTAWPFAG